jgi:hypothetical protein
MYIDYNVDTTVNSLAKAVRTQGAVEFSPWKTGQTVTWMAQGPDDYEYISSASAAGFNTRAAASFQIYGENLGNGTKVGYIHLSAILEYTGRQTV